MNIQQSTPMTPLRVRMIADMSGRNLGPASQTSHLRACKRFAAWLERSPETATPDDVKYFQQHLVECGTSICTRNQTMTGVKFLFRVTLRRHDLVAEIFHLREPDRVPLVLSQKEIKRILAMASSLKARVMLSLAYGCGMRAGEVVRLKVGDIDSAQEIIRIVQAIVASEDAGISVVVPKPMTSNAAARGQFDKADFAYDSDRDVYVCPADANLTYRFTGQQDGKAIRSYWSGACADCVIKDKCTTSKERRVRRWEHEHVLERVQERLDEDPAQLAVRSMTVEHPYGTIKSWMGATHFKMRTLKNVATEMALHVLAYNMTRVMKILGIPAMIAAMKA